LGAIPPGEFIPLAEDTGLIIPLGRQVLKMACCQVALWNRYFQAKLTVSVNVSAKQLADKDFLSSVKSVLDELQFDPSLLKFEITESILLNNRQAAQHVLSAARAMGIEICLDDFGTGYSSLSYLLDFPFDTIKIDRSFVQNVDHNPQRAEMLRTIVQLAKKLNKKVIAEGIETLAQLKFLDAIPCDFVQGFLFSKPLVPEIITELLEAELGTYNS
jgi:diguanylate cyclase